MFFIKCPSISVVVGSDINSGVLGAFYASFWTRFDHQSVVILEFPRLHFSCFLRTFWIFGHSVVVGSVNFSGVHYTTFLRSGTIQPISTRVVVGWNKNAAFRTSISEMVRHKIIGAVGASRRERTSQSRRTVQTRIPGRPPGGLIILKKTALSNGDF